MTLAWGLFHIISQQSGGVRQCRPQPRLRLSVCSWLIWEWENLPRAKHPQPPHHLSTLLQQRGSFQTRAAGGKHLWISKTLHSVFQTSNHTHYTHTNHDGASAWRRMICNPHFKDMSPSVLLGIHFCGVLACSAQWWPANQTAWAGAVVYLYPDGQRNGLQAARPGISFAPWKKYFHILWVVFRLRLFQLIKQSCEKKIDLGDFNV